MEKNVLMEKYREKQPIINPDDNRMIIEILKARGINPIFLQNPKVRNFIIDNVKEIFMDKSNENDLDGLDLKIKIGVTKGTSKSDLRVSENGDLCILTRKIELGKLRADVINKIVVTEEVSEGRRTGNILVRYEDKNSEKLKEERYDIVQSIEQEI